MKAKEIKIASITINNFKNVCNGSLSLLNTRKNYRASIMGLYGQNGSGKTALIDAIELLQHALCGRPIPEKYYDFINLDSNSASFQFVFRVSLSSSEYALTYQFSINRELRYRDQNTDSAQKTMKTVSISNEVLKCPIVTDKGAKMGRLIDATDSLFSPISKRDLLIGKDKERLELLRKAKDRAEYESRSFIFSRDLLTLIRANVQSKKDQNDLDSELNLYFSLIESLVEFGNFGLFVINTANSGIISLNTQPIIFKYDNKVERTGAIGTIMLPLDQPVLLGKKEKKLVEEIIKSMNTVLNSIIPGLTVDVKDLGNQLMEDGSDGTRIQLLSCKNGRKIALKNESEGVKKIISILQLLIVAYNQPTITVAVDELDSGVFEYLLGELLRIISEKGKGQLIFTSHNLRPLETLDRGFIAFTTTNPNNRYIRLTNVKDNNNLRDFYYRDIMLGEQSEVLYETTNNAEIALAFREAGEYNGA